MAQVGKIRCDLCGFIGDLESFNGRAQMRTPSGWVAIHTTIRISGERVIAKDERKALKTRIAARFPLLHVCPGCYQTDRIYHASRLIPMMPSHQAS